MPYVFICTFIEDTFCPSKDLELTFWPFMLPVQNIFNKAVIYSSLNLLSNYVFCDYRSVVMCLIKCDILIVYQTWDIPLILDFVSLNLHLHFFHNANCFNCLKFSHSNLNPKWSLSSFLFLKSCNSFTRKEGLIMGYKSFMFFYLRIRPMVRDHTSHNEWFCLFKNLKNNKGTFPYAVVGAQFPYHQIQSHHRHIQRNTENFPLGYHMEVY